MRNKLVTPGRARMIKRDATVYDEYIHLTEDPDVSKVKAIEYLMRKYKIYSISTVYAIIHRVEKRMMRKEGK